MIKEVLGKAILFAGTTIGPVLPRELLEYVKSIEPNKFYPPENFVKMLFIAQEKNVRTLIAGGKTWAQVQKPLLEKAGVKTPEEALVEAARISVAGSFNGTADMTVDLEAPGKAVIREDTGLPPELYAAIWEGHVIAWGGAEVKVEVEQPEEGINVFRVTWSMKAE